MATAQDAGLRKGCSGLDFMPLNFRGLPLPSRNHHCRQRVKGCGKQNPVCQMVSQCNPPRRVQRRTADLQGCRVQETKTTGVSNEREFSFKQREHLKAAHSRQVNLQRYQIKILRVRAFSIPVSGVPGRLHVAAGLCQPITIIIMTPGSSSITRIFTLAVITLKNFPSGALQAGRQMAGAGL